MTSEVFDWNDNVIEGNFELRRTKFGAKLSNNREISDCVPIGNLDSSTQSWIQINQPGRRARKLHLDHEEYRECSWDFRGMSVSSKPHLHLLWALNEQRLQSRRQSTLQNSLGQRKLLISISFRPHNHFHSPTCFNFDSWFKHHLHKRKKQWQTTRQWIIPWRSARMPLTATVSYVIWCLQTSLGNMAWTPPR